jgi:hypothetical protein
MIESNRTAHMKSLEELRQYLEVRIVMAKTSDRNARRNDLFTFNKGVIFAFEQAKGAVESMIRGESVAPQPGRPATPPGPPGPETPPEEPPI